MRYGNLAAEAVQRFTSLDLEKVDVTIKEREEYESHIANGFSVYAGVNYQNILRLAEKTADVINFDGGNNDFSFKPDLLITVTDELRPGR